MNTQAIAGYSGRLSVSADSGVSFTEVMEIKDGTITISSEPLDATSYNSGGWMENITGLRSWEFSGEGNYIWDDAGFIIIRDYLVAATPVNQAAPLCWNFYPKFESGLKAYRGNAVVASIEIGAPTEDVVNMSLSLTGTGVLSVFDIPA